MQGRIPRAFIDELIARVDIVDLIDARVPLKKSGKDYVARCPFHDERTPSFSVSRSKQFYYCFGCGAGGNAITFLMEYDHLDFVEAIQELAQSQGLEIPSEAQATNQQSRDIGALTALYDLQAGAAALYADQLRRPDARPAVEYLKARGVSGAMAQTYRLGFAPRTGDLLASQLDRKRLREAGLLSSRDDSHDLFRNRIIFPIRDRRGRTIGFGGRVLDDSKPKYLNSPETPTFHKSHEVYGLYELLESHAKPAHILVVEGYMDVIALAQHGVRHAVATLGTATTREHVELLFRHTGELIFSFDGDSAGRKAAQRAMESALPSLREGRQIRIMLLPEGQDPDTLIRQEGKERFEQRTAASPPLSDYFFEHLSEDLNLQEIEGRAALIDRSKPLVGQIPEGAFKDLMLDKLKQLARVTSLEISQKRATLSNKSAHRRSTRTIRTTPLRVAVALLLQNPEIAANAGNMPQGWRQLDSPGARLLQQILELLEKNPSLKPGGILERFRGTPEENQIRLLTLCDTMIPESGVETEFRDALMRLCEQADREQLEKLLVKAEQGSISEQEREDLRRLLTKSH